MQFYSHLLCLFSMNKTETKDQWGEMAEKFSLWSSPQRPCQEDVELFEKLHRGHGSTLLLGVTKELHHLATAAIDNNPKMIEKFRGDLPVFFGDWADLPFEKEFDTIIGDGSLNGFDKGPDLFFSQAKKALKKNGDVLLRVFIAPEIKEDVDRVIETKNLTEFHAFKWRIAAALADPFVPVQKIYDVIYPIWNHKTLDVYNGSDLVYYFPKLSELPPYDAIIYPNSYELAKRCPLLLWHL